MNFHRNDLIDKVLERNFESFEITVDTVDYVPKRYLKKIYRIIYRNLKRQIRWAKLEDRAYQRKLGKKDKQSYQRKNATTTDNATRRKTINPEQGKLLSVLKRFLSGKRKESREEYEPKRRRQFSAQEETATEAQKDK